MPDKVTGKLSIAKMEGRGDLPFTILKMKETTSGIRMHWMVVLRAGRL
jgi:hypothetical protein